MKNPLFLALDVDDADQALALVKATHEFVGGYKVGSRLGLRYGAPLLQQIAKHGHMFIDNKYFDIPSTMEGAVRASFDLGASYCTIHAQAGREAMSRLAGVEAELNRQRPFRLLAVTILTSFNQQGLPLTAKVPIGEQALTLAQLTIDCGLTGLVCSVDEVEALHQRFPQAFLVTPGVRLENEARGDQSRVADPRTALHRGASALVVGRPIYAAVDPARAAKMYYEEVQKA